MPSINLLSLPKEILNLNILPRVVEMENSLSKAENVLIKDENPIVKIDNSTILHKHDQFVLWDSEEDVERVKDARKGPLELPLLYKPKFLPSFARVSKTAHIAAIDTAISIYMDQNYAAYSPQVRLSTQTYLAKLDLSNRLHLYTDPASIKIVLDAPRATSVQYVYANVLKSISRDEPSVFAKKTSVTFSDLKKLHFIVPVQYFNPISDAVSIVDFEAQLVCYTRRAQEKEASRSRGGITEHLLVIN